MIKTTNYIKKCSLATTRRPHKRRDLTFPCSEGHSFEGSLISHAQPRMRDAFAQCASFSASNVYRSREVLDVELAGYKIIDTLLELFTDAIVRPDKAYSKRLIDRVSSQYQINAPTLTGRLIGVLDYITGMTDVYALDLYRKINGMSLPNI